MTALLNVSPDSRSTSQRVKAMCLLAGLAAMQGDVPDAVAWRARVPNAGATIDEPAIRSHVLLFDGMFEQFRGDVDSARAVASEGRTLAQRHGLHWFECRHLQNLAELALGAGDSRLAFGHITEALRVARAAGDVWSEAMALNGLGDVLRFEANAAAAERAYLDARALFHTIETLANMPRDAWPGLPHNLGYVTLARGSPDRARLYFLESAEGYERFGPDWRGVAECVMGLGAVAACLEQPVLAAQLFGAAEAALERLGTTYSMTNRADYARALEQVRAKLDPKRVGKAWHAGRSLELSEALRLAGELKREAEQTQRKDGLTPRELEVARLVARGMSNRQVAEALVITEKTAANHVQHVLEKLELRSRGQLAARATEFAL